jgi:hypothetical protein
MKLGGKTYHGGLLASVLFLAFLCEVFLYYFALFSSLKSTYLVEKSRDEILPPGQSPCVLMPDAYNTSVCEAHLTDGFFANRDQSNFRRGVGSCVALVLDSGCTGYLDGQVGGLQADHYGCALNARNWLVSLFWSFCLLGSQLLVASCYSNIARGVSALLERAAQGYGRLVSPRLGFIERERPEFSSLPKSIEVLFFFAAVGLVFGIELGLVRLLMSAFFHVDDFSPADDSSCVVLPKALQATCFQGATCGVGVNAGRSDYVHDFLVITAACSPDSGADSDHKTAYWWGETSGQMFAMMAAIFGSDVSDKDWGAIYWVVFMTMLAQAIAVIARRPIANTYAWFQRKVTGVTVEEIDPVVGGQPSGQPGGYGAVPHGST